MSRPSIALYHRGALGDSILLWPILRALRRDHDVTLITDGSKARLAAAELNINALDAEHPRFNALWLSTRTPASSPIPGLSRLIAFLGPGSVNSEAVNTWRTNAAALFPRADIELISTRPNRLEPRHLPRDPSPANAQPRDPAAPIVIHVGAGHPSKRWPLDRWSDLATRLRARPVRSAPAITVLAGEAELDRFTAAERALFAELQGRYVHTLDDLAHHLRHASLVLAHDSGPAHLAAQLGAPTLALFGPTDPHLWAPVGPATLVLAPPTPTPDCTWADLDLVDHAARTLRARHYHQP